MRELAKADFAALRDAGYVVRDGLQPEAAKVWRSTMRGLAHRAGFRADTGQLSAGTVWASVNRDSPPDTDRSAIGYARH
jgi:hypothetical protein